MKAGKKAWAKMSPAKKAKTIARLRRVRPKSKGGGGSKAITKSNPTGGGGGSTALTKKKAPQIGAGIEMGRSAITTLSPLVDQGLLAADPAAEKFTAQEHMAMLKEKVVSIPYATNVAVGIVDGVASVKFGHATALTKGSVTAWAAELFPLYAAYVEAEATSGNGIRKTRQGFREYVLRTRGYDVMLNKTVWAALKEYGGLKVGGGLVRRWSNVGPLRKVARPVKMFLSWLGGRI